MTMTRLTNSEKLSAVITPKLVALRFHSRTEAAAAPTRPMMARPPSGIRSPRPRNASASMHDEARQRDADDGDDGVERVAEHDQLPPVGMRTRRGAG